MAKSKGANISALIEGLIRNGKTDEEIWEVLKSEYDFGLDKKHYPIWYRCRMRRKGRLPKIT